MINGVTINSFLDKRRIKRDETYPIKLTVYYNGQKKRYSTGINVTEDQWNKMQKKIAKSKEIITLKEKLSIITGKAQAIIQDELNAFSFEAFERFYKSTKSDLNNIYIAFDNYKKKLKQENRYGTAISFQSSLFSLKKYTKREYLSYSEITADFLKGYENWMLKSEKSLTTVGIYLRNLRTIFNEAITHNIIKKENYPFGRNKYIIPAGKNIKKALTLQDISKIFNYPASETTYEALSKDIWIFSYLCSGINICDVLRLKYENIDETYIIFLRKKTDNRERTKPAKQVIVKRNFRIDRIIERWGNNSNDPKSYIFPILNNVNNPNEEYLKIKYFTKLVNKHIGNIAKSCGIERKVTSYTARHTYSTVLKRAGVPIEYISESLGHSNIKVTENYLDGFDDDSREKYSKELTNFREPPKK